MGAFLLVPLIALTAVAGFCVAAYAAHLFMAVLGSTAAGSDQVQWDDESFLDWIGKLVQVGWMAGVWLAPAVLIGRAAAGGAAGSGVALAVFWLAFPISAFSAMSGETNWALFRPAILHRFGKRRSRTQQFYLLSAAVVAAGGFCAMSVFGALEYGLAGTAACAVGAALAWVLYARLVGRFGFVLSFVAEPARKKPKKKSTDELSEDPERPDLPTPEGVPDGPPVVLPRSAWDDEEDGPLTYKVGQAEPTDPPPVAKFAPEAGGESEPVFAVAAEPAGAAPEPPPVAEPINDGPAKPRHPRKKKRKNKPDADRPVEPKRPWDGALVSFLGDAEMAVRTFILAAGLAAFGGLLAAVRAMSEEFS